VESEFDAHLLRDGDALVEKALRASISAHASHSTPPRVDRHRYFDLALEHVYLAAGLDVDRNPRPADARHPVAGGNGDADLTAV
jgi:hypothetical protein